MATTRTNQQLNDAFDGLTDIFNNITTSDLSMTNGLSRVGLKDGSGSNGDVFVQNASLYLKINNQWYHAPCASLGLGL